MDNMYKIKVMLSSKIFIQFAWFNAFIRQGRWKLLVAFSFIMLAFSSIAYFFAPKESQSGVLVMVLMIVAVFIPLAYIYQFYLSLKKQCKNLGLVDEQYVYTIKFENLEILIENQKETINYHLNSVNKIFIDKECVYLFVSENKAYLLPFNCIDKGEKVFIEYINLNLTDKTKLKYVRRFL